MYESLLYAHDLLFPVSVKLYIMLLFVNRVLNYCRRIKIISTIDTLQGADWLGGPCCTEIIYSVFMSGPLNKILEHNMQPFCFACLRVRYIKDTTLQYEYNHSYCYFQC